MRLNNRLRVIAASTLLSVGASVGVGATPAHAAVTWRVCSGTDAYRTWVNLDIQTAAGLVDYCFGGKGTWVFNTATNNVRVLCPGNNFGHLDWIMDGKDHTYDFSPSSSQHTFAGPARAIELVIDRWSGDTKCPRS